MDQTAMNTTQMGVDIRSSSDGEEARRTKVAAKEVDVFYGEKQAIHSVSIDVPEKSSKMPPT